jgi:peptide/nickel transport system substrate-binding protein
MVENDAQGRIVGYRPGRRLRLVRNPSWNPATDFRPARTNAFVLDLGDADPTRPRAGSCAAAA